MAAEVLREPALLGVLDELARREETASRVLPADQRLDAANLAGGEVGLRLEVDEQLFVLQRFPELARAAPRVEGRLVRPDAAVAGRLGRGESDARPAKHRREVARVVVQGRSADARRDGDGHGVDRDRRSETGGDPLGDPFDVRGLVRRDQDRELVLAEARDELAVGQLPAEPERDLQEHGVAAVRAEDLVELGEAVDVDQQQRSRPAGGDGVLERPLQRLAVRGAGRLVVHGRVLDLRDLAPDARV